MPEILLSTPQYSYLESGLKNIHISPAPIIACEMCRTKRLKINDLALLNFTIVKATLLKPFALLGEDLRFLRQYLEFPLSYLARLLHIEEETIFALENKQELISPHFDLLIRLFYIRLLEERFGKIFTDNLIKYFAKINFDNQDNSIVLINLDTLPEYYYLQSS